LSFLERLKSILALFSSERIYIRSFVRLKLLKFKNF